MTGYIEFIYHISVFLSYHADFINFFQYFYLFFHLLHLNVKFLQRYQSINKLNESSRAICHSSQTTKL